MIPSRASIAAAVLLVLLSGCLPYSCRREESSALLPADSLSRTLAAAIAVDTLELRWASDGGPDETLEHPRTVRFGPAGSDTIYVSDAEMGRLFVFDTDGSLRRTLATVDVPFLAGVAADTVAVFDPSVPAFQFLVDGEAVETVSIDDAGRPRTALVYGAYGDGRLYYKRVDTEKESFVAQVNPNGELSERHILEGPQWRHAGLLRLWGDSVLSLSGYRPVMDVVDDGRTDTLALHGFDSPMLARTRSFMMGDVREAPLLSSSAAPSGDFLFVLNMRPGWLQIDVFDRRGQLVRRLTERKPDYQSSFFPQDLDVRRLTDGSHAIAVAFSAPRPSVRYYTWNGLQPH